MGGLVIAVEKVRSTPRRFDLEADDIWWQEARKGLAEGEARMRRPFRLAVQAHRIGRRLLFRGDLEGSVDLLCSRCLERYEQAFAEPVQLLLEPAPERQDDFPECGIDLDPDDPEIGRYAGDELDFGPAVREVLALTWPMQPRCGESCRGLCPSCGTNWNLGECDCEEAPVAGPFASLKDLIRRARQRQG